MKSRALRLSLAANCVLAMIVAVLLWRERSGVTADPAPAAPVARPHAIETPPPKAAARAELPPPSGASQLTPTAVAQLEQMGISREVLVNALLGEFHRRWDRRFAELEKRYAPGHVPEHEYIELGRQREAEQVRELKEALGEDRYLAWDKEQTLRIVNAAGIPLTAAEAEQAYRLQKDFEEQSKAAQMAMEDGVADPADVGTVHTQAQASLDRHLEQLLGPERFRAMRGLTDPLADVYRMFGDLKPTSSQAQAVLRAEEDHRAREAALAAKLSQTPDDAANVAAELQAIQEARDENLRQILGAEAYDAMQRRNDRSYQMLTQFASAWELQDHEIQPVYETVRTFHDVAERTRAAAAMRETAGQRVDWQQVNAAIEQARQQTEASLQHLIGSNRLWRLKQNGMLSTR